MWGRPQTTGSTQLTNFSLNIVSASTGFDVDAASIEVYNPVLSTTRSRFEYVSDSSDGLVDVDANLPVAFNRGVAGLQGFTIDSATADGFGGSCDAKDDYCDDSSGVESWLIASFSLIPNTAIGAADLYLQVGLNGMNHSGELPADMEVSFGVDSVGPAPPAYDPSLDLQQTHADDDADASLMYLMPGDYDTDGDVDTDDYTEWRTSYGGANYAADGNSDRAINAADYTVWRDHLPPPPAPVASANAAPEPGAALIAAASLMLRGASRRRAPRRLLASNGTG